MNQQFPQTMEAAAIDHFGGIETLSVQDLPVPTIDRDEVLIRIDTAGVGVWDTFEREGGFAQMMGITPAFPYVLGTDGAGTIEAVGQNVAQFKKGDRVYAMALANPKGGFYAQYSAVKADQVSKIPGTLSIEEAGVMPVDAVTALMGLDDTLHLQRGESILILGASGGIGHLAVQLAQRLGARVFAIASGKDGVDLVSQLGADRVVDGHHDDVAEAARDFAPNGIDTALLTAGGRAANDALQSIRKGGRVAYPNGVEPEPTTSAGVKLSSYDGIPTSDTLAKLNRLIEAGPFRVHVARTFPLDRAADAQRALEEHYLGKLALKPN